MDKPDDVRSESLTNRLLDEGVMLVVKAADAEGIRITAKTAIRWCLSGVRGIRLESLKIGGQRSTSRAALRRFIAATQPKPQGSAANTTLHLDAQAADRILRAHGLHRQDASS
jgi:hypothetical protein